MKNENHALALDQLVKHRKPKYREVSSRFLSPNSTSFHETGNPSPKQGFSPNGRKPGSSLTDIRRNRSGQLDNSASSVRGLWPSTTTSSSSSSSSSSSTKKLDSLADHLGNERLNDLLERRNSLFLDRQTSCREFSRFENDKDSAKGNYRPILGGSFRYSEKNLPGKSSSTSSSSSNKLINNFSNLVPGRLSVDENVIYHRSSRRLSDNFTDTINWGTIPSDAHSAKDTGSPSEGRSSKLSSRKTGIEVSSKYKNTDKSTNSRRGTSDSNIQNPISLDSSPELTKFTIKNVIKRSNSLNRYGNAMSQWALSPGRSGSSPTGVENRGKSLSYSNLKPPNSPSKTKGVEKLFHLGLELFKSKKSSSSSSSSSSSNLLPGVSTEASHELRLLHNRWMQWLYANARADTVSASLANNVVNNLLCSWDGLTKLQYSVLHKRLRLEKEKLEMKLNFILHSQFNPLEAWGDIERQHTAAVSMIKECLYSVVYRIPLTEGAKVEIQSASIAFRHASDLAASVKSMLTNLSPSAEKTVSLLSELAEVVAQEKLLLEECLELFRTISILEIQERSLECGIIQMESWQQQQ